MFLTSNHSFASDAGYAHLGADLAVDDGIDVDAILASSRYATLGGGFEDDLLAVDVDAVLASSRLRAYENV